MTVLIEEKHKAARQQFFAVSQKLLLLNGGWSDRLLEDISQECGFDKNYHYILFPSGVREVVEFFESCHDANMLQALNQQDVPAKIRARIALALKIRIKNTPPPIHVKNNAYFLLVENVCCAIKIAWNSCDLIWHYAGDTATDFNYYSKRGLLVSVYLSSILFYIADKSENAVDTDKFIEDSLENIIGIAKLKNFAKLPELSDIPILRLFF